MNGNDVEPGKGNIVVGVMLVLVGLAIALDRAGVIQWSGMWSMWPLILGGIGVARFISTPAGEPKEGLIFMTAAAWLLASDAGWIAIEDSWPLLVIAVGLIIAFNGGRRRRWPWPDPNEQANQAAAGVPPIPPGTPWDSREARRMRRRMYRRRRSLSPLAILGIWIAIFIGFQMSGTSRFRDWNSSRNTAAAVESTSDRVQIVSVMGRSDHVSRSTAFRGANVTNIMGRSDIDLRDATLAPGATASLQVFSMMGAVVLRVPPTWTVDIGAVSAMGGIQDDRPKPRTDEEGAASGAPPRLVLRGLVTMGRLTIR
jgi:hypothetical protein